MWAGLWQPTVHSGPTQGWSLTVTTWLSNITFHLWPIWQQNLVVIDSESCQTSCPRFFSLPSEVAVLFNSNLRWRPPRPGCLIMFIRFAVFLRIQFGNAILFLCHIFSQRPMNDQKKKLSYWHCLCQQQLLSLASAYSIQNFEREKVTFRSLKFTNH